MKSRCNSLTRIFLNSDFRFYLELEPLSRAAEPEAAVRSGVRWPQAPPPLAPIFITDVFYQSEIWKPHLYFSDTCELLQMLSVISRLSSPDVVPAALLLPLSALCCLLLPGQCHWSVSGSPLPLQRLLWSHLGGPAAAPPRPVRHTHTDVLNWF